MKQEAHVKQFLLTEAALQAGQIAEQQLHALIGDTTKYDCCNWALSPVLQAVWLHFSRNSA